MRKAWVSIVKNVKNRIQRASNCAMDHGDRHRKLGRLWRGG